MAFCVLSGNTFTQNMPLYWNPVTNNGMSQEAEILSTAGGIIWLSCSSSTTSSIASVTPSNYTNTTEATNNSTNTSETAEATTVDVSTISDEDEEAAAAARRRRIQQPRPGFYDGKAS